MNPFNKEKILSYYEDALDIKNGHIPAPRMALIYPTYKCNYNCTYCLYKDMNNKLGREMSVQQFKALIDELKRIGIKAIEFCGGGEPLMYPGIEQIIQYIADKGIELGVFTNGSMLDKHYKILIDNATYIRISLDTINEDTFNKMKGVSMGNILNNINMTSAYRDKTKSKCSLGLKVVLSKYNIDEMQSLIHFVDRSGFDYIQFKSVCSDDSVLTDEQKRQVQHFLDFWKSKKVRGSAIKTALESPCIMSPIHTMIDAYGDVYLCCYYQYRRDTHKIGNVLKNTFLDIWYSNRHTEAIKNINMNECNKYDCRFHGYNKTMIDVIDKNETHINFI